MKWLGLLAFVFYAIHGGFNLSRHHPAELLWACHLGALLCGLGLLTRSAAINAIGLSWLVLGDLMWVSDVLVGGEFLPTSLFTHGGGLALGLVGVRWLGWSRYTYGKAVLAFAGLQQLTRLLTPRAANVNMAFFLPDSWRWLYPSYGMFLLANYAVALAVFYVVERLATRAVASRRPMPGTAASL